MIIELPKRFERTENQYSFVRIRNGMLELKGDFDFEKTMIELAYKIKGKTRCFYCRRQVSPNKITIDHLFPSDFGGVTITNNLEPACHSCNSSKSNMNQYEYSIWRTINSKEERKKYYHQAISKKMGRKKNPDMKRGFDLPRKWITYVPLSKVKKVTKIDNRESEKFKRMLIFARRYNKLPRPLVISSNYVLLDGETAYAVATEMRFEEVPVIWLENVIVIR